MDANLGRDEALNAKGVIQALRRARKTKTSPFNNLPEARRGPWGEGFDSCGDGEMPPQLIGTIDYLERTVTNHLQDARFVGLSRKSALRGS